MNKRAIVNVATGEFYCKMQKRLLESLANSCDANLSMGDNRIINQYFTTSYGIDLLLWIDCLPAGSRPHSESPYGFKVHAVKAAYEMGYTSILWLDSPAYAVKEDISPIFDKIEKEGYYAMSHIDPLENWVGQKALVDVDVPRKWLVGKNLPSGSCYGFDFKSETTRNVFETIAQKERKGFFCNEFIPNVGNPTGYHRHDEAILALTLLRFNLPVFTFDPLFQSDSPECVIKSGG